MSVVYHVPNILFSISLLLVHFHFEPQKKPPNEPKTKVITAFLLFPQTSVPSGYSSSWSTWPKAGSLKMIINIDPSYRVSVGRCEGERGILTPSGCWEDQWALEDGWLLVVVTRPKRLHNLGSTSLPSSLYSYPFFLHLPISPFTFEHYNEHACENACVCASVQGRYWADLTWNKPYFSPTRGYWFGGNKAVICWALTLGRHDIRTLSPFL